MGPLKGYRIVEIAGIGPGPFACMMLADMGADVIRLERPTGARGVDAVPANVLNRGRRSVGIDLKHPDGVGLVLDLVAEADALVEGWRPGVAERLGLGPEQCWERNARLVYGRMTGWGQDGPLAPTAGHDIDYIALSGALWSVGRAHEAPVPPINLVGDFGGGGMLLAFGLVAALVEARTSGRGQVVDAAMVDGSALLATFIHGLRAGGAWRDQRGSNLLDGGAPFYDTYQTADGKFVAVGALESKFYAELVQRLGLEVSDLPPQLDPAGWPALRERLTAAFGAKTQAEWVAVFDGSDACVTPVLSMADAPGHPHNQARGTFIEVGGVCQPAPAPRFSRTPAATPAAPPVPGSDTEAILTGLGYSPEEITALRDQQIAC